MTILHPVIMGVIFWVSVVGLLVGGYLSSRELREYADPYVEGMYEEDDTSEDN